MEEELKRSFNIFSQSIDEQKLLNILCTAYLSGLHEVLGKLNELSPEDIKKNIDDTQTLRQYFLQNTKTNLNDKSPSETIKYMKLIIK